MQSFYRVNQKLEQEKVGNKVYKSIYSTRTLRSYNKCAELIATIRIKHRNLLIKSFWVKPEFELNAVVSKGQIILKRFFLVEDYSKKQTKTSRILVKTNSFDHFLEESSA